MGKRATPKNTSTVSMWNEPTAVERYREGWDRVFGKQAQCTRCPHQRHTGRCTVRVISQDNLQPAECGCQGEPA